MACIFAACWDCVWFVRIWHAFRLSLFILLSYFSTLTVLRRHEAKQVDRPLLVRDWRTFSERQPLLWLTKDRYRVRRAQLPPAFWCVSSCWGRTGRWHSYETMYAQRIVADFDAGTMPLSEGTKLGNFLCNILNCSPS